MAVQNDLTQGGVSRKLVSYALPYIASSVMQAVYAIVDLLVVSRVLGEAGASGVSNGVLAMTMMTQIAIGLATGGNVLVSQYFGAGDKKKQERVSGTFITMFLLGGIACSALYVTFSGSIARLMDAPAYRETVEYLRACSVGLVFVFLYNCLSSILRGVGNSRVPMIAVVTTTLLNVGLDIYFVAGRNMGTDGAAWATVIAQGVCFLIVLGYLLTHREVFSFHPAVLRPRGREMSAILKLGFPCAVQMTVAGVSWMAVYVLVNGYGVECSAAAAYSNKIKELCHMVPGALSNAAAVMIAQNLGAGKFDRAREVVRVGMRLSVGITLGLVIGIELGCPWMLRIFTEDPAVLDVAARCLRIEIVGQLAYAAFFIYHSMMIGAGHTNMVLLSSFVNCILFRIVLALIFNALMGMDGIFVACAVAPVSSIPVGWLYLRSGRWRRNMAQERGGTP